MERSVRIPEFIRDEQNRQILSWLGGGLVVIATALWGAFVFFWDQSSDNVAPQPSQSSMIEAQLEPSKPNEPRSGAVGPSENSVSANDGSIAVQGDSNTVTQK